MDLKELDKPKYKCVNFMLSKYCSKLLKFFFWPYFQLVFNWTILTKTKFLSWHWGELLTEHKFTTFNRSDFLFRWHWSRLQTITSSSSWKTKYSEITGTLRHSFTSATRPSRKVAIIQNERILILTNYLWLF